MRKLLALLAILALTAPLAFYGCGSGDTGAAGANGTNGTDGTDGTDGTNGIDGTPGTPGAPGTPGTPGTPGASGAATITEKHGTAALDAEELAAAGKYRANVNVTSATADAAGVATITFTVKNGTTPVTGITAVSAGIFKLAPKGGGLAYNRWVPYIYRPGRTVLAGYRENNTSSTPRGTLVENGSGSYTYTFGTNLSTATFSPVDNVTLVGYDRALTHRVSVYMGGHSGPTGEDDFDFVPSGGSVTATRNIVLTAACKKCHGVEFAGHGGDRVTVEGCVTCHSPYSAMVNTTANGGTTETIEMAVMIHKIHAGRELPSSSGVDGQFYDNPNTGGDETADNYAAYAYTVGSLSATWRTAAFPAVIANCQACHTGSGVDVDNWNTVPSRAACGSCHDLIDWGTGLNHGGGLAPSDDFCVACHPSTGVGYGKSVTVAHDWTQKDIRNKQEFNIALTVNTPGRGYFDVGESPVISIALTDSATGAVIVPSTVVEDPGVTGPLGGKVGEGCIPKVGFEGTECTVTRNGKFRAASIYVTGPRSQRIPVLTYPARAKVTSGSAGPWNFNTASVRNLGLVVDGGMPMLEYNDAIAYEGYGADELITGAITVPYDNSFFPDNTAATPAQVAAWLNANRTFHARAIAYVDEARAGSANAGKLSIRSRGILKKSVLGEIAQVTAQPSIAILNTGPADMFPLDTTTGLSAFGGAGGAGGGRIMATVNKTDPKADFTDATKIRYALDNVDDLVPGTYVINVEYADAGRGPGNAGEPPYVDYRTPSIAVATFQVKTATVQKQIADACTACHWSDAGTGFVLDPPRHNKPFRENAVDQCGGCHDYASAQNPANTYAYPPASGGTFSSGHPISKRVHAVHNGANLNYPTITVAHEETAAFGRNWRITYPQEIRNCESCHSDAGSSGSWKTNPNRLACMGCHDSDAATAHMQAQTYDPTPNAPFSGDERESCKTCH